MTKILAKMAEYFREKNQEIIAVFAHLSTLDPLVKYNSTVFLNHARMEESALRLAMVINAHALLVSLAMTVKTEPFAPLTLVNMEVHALRLFKAINACVKTVTRGITVKILMLVGLTLANMAEAVKP